MKACGSCNEIKPLYEFHRRPSTEDGKTRRCSTCRNTAARAEYVRNKKTYSDNAKRRYAMDADKNAAKYAVHKAIIDGDITRPTICSSCGRQHTHIDAHHASYDEPLKVEFLCRRCHWARHLMRVIA